MYTRLFIAFLVVITILIQGVTSLLQTKGALISTRISIEQSDRTAVLSVINGFANQPGTVNPLVGKTMALFRESFEGFLRRTGMFSGPPGSNSKVNPLFAWSLACRSGMPVCQQALYEMRSAHVVDAKMDASGRVVLTAVAPGTYYLLANTSHNRQHLLWDLRVDLKAGPNAVTLNQLNTTPVDEEQARARATTSGTTAPNAGTCRVTESPRPVTSGPRNSTLSVVGTGYVYTYTQTDRRTGQVVDSFTERGNFINTTLYLLDQDADTILQRAGIERGILGSRLEMFTFLDAGTQVGNAAPIEIMASLFGRKDELDAFTAERKAEFECVMKAIKAHSVAEATTDDNARATFPSVPAGTYYLFGRFYRITKPVRGGGVLWNLEVRLKSGRNAKPLSVNNAALK